MIKFVGTAQKDKESLLYYSQTKNGQIFFKVVTSTNGFEFNDNGKYVIITNDKQKEETNFDWKSLRVSKQAEQYILTYLPNTKSPTLQTAFSIDLIRFRKSEKIGEVNETGTIVSDYEHKGHHVMYFGEKEIKIAYAPDFTLWKVNDKPLLSARPTHFDNGELTVGNVYLIKEHILLIYYVKTVVDKKTVYHAAAALFDHKNPEKLIWRSDEPLWHMPKELQNEKMSPLGSVILNDELILYWVIGDNNVFAVSCPIPTPHTGLRNKNFSALFKKADNNPIISPRPDRPWESRATFNSAAVFEDGKVHFVYRALGDTDLSVLGYATSTDGLTIDERSEDPIYIPREDFETPGQRVFKTFADHFMSGGGYGGVEDPRITKVDDTFFMTYVAFDGANPPRVALTSITVNDFLNRRWDKWEKPRLISSPGMVNKNAVIFPEKINGKYVVYHRIYPNVLIDYVDDLNFEDKFLTGHHFIPPRKTHWDSKKIGAGAPPIKTKDGWLFIYQSVGYQDPGRYKIGAMLLDHNDPSKVICRADSPIVEPNEAYENDGFKAGVVYPCGAVAIDNKLHVYYGGADTVVCAASTDLDKFLWEMKHNQEPKLRRVRTPVIS
jgi:beta-1,2-mannobiose phosphorylase / 1,2-beta-oligomannan phosphorylase